MPGHVYFPEEQPALAERLDQFLAALRDDLAANFPAGEARALFLAGGYGRGEGGVFQREGNSAPELYNDLEFYLVLADGAPAGTGEEWTHRWSHEGERQLGIEVEFKILRERALREAGPSMFYYDLLAAHRLVYPLEGAAFPTPERLLDSALIPAYEATRLLFNRGSGLFFSAVALAREDEKTRDGFIERNHAKMRLALGDAVLALNGRYHFSCQERDRRLAEPLAARPPDFPEIRTWHEDGVRFKLHPRHLHPSLEELRATQGALGKVWTRTWLWLEAHRLSRTFADAAAYADFRGRLYPHTPAWRNFALHARDRLRRGSALPGWTDYPRAALGRALVLLLQPQMDLSGAARVLGSESTLESIHATYERWWRIYN